MSRQGWSVSDDCIFNGEWERQRMLTYSATIEQRQRRPDFSVQYSSAHKGYVCPYCPNFSDRDVDVVMRHSLHCNERVTSREARGWWPDARQ